MNARPPLPGGRSGAPRGVSGPYDDDDRRPGVRPPGAPVDPRRAGVRRGDARGVARRGDRPRSRAAGESGARRRGPRELGRDEPCVPGAVVPVADLSARLPARRLPAPRGRDRRRRRADRGRRALRGALVVALGLSTAALATSVLRSRTVALGIVTLLLVDPPNLAMFFWGAY